ncbi:MAG: biotin--[acetyl-CoA-carboxylase] ligase [Lactobacillus sp.]|jgi:BirA family biotin operon repressor/biotin-[acetyl-CoA-carboxylase] ligase|nr:biotin--[acetyl-CoA-carboxylase] ligase [Lactobacillus sp.]MCI2032910.1 biotin--[acetyl-CoA-carboxylase] ligase [Lactobacillus sp.]
MPTTKQRVLRALLAQQAQWQSGDALAQELGLSRESVWKAINALRKAGHTIDARKSQGYQYLGCAQLDADVISYYAAVAAPIVATASVESTQGQAKAWLSQQTVVGTAAFFAGEQTAGYGRRGRAYYSPAETGLYFSVVLPNTLHDLTKVGLVTTGVATACLGVLQRWFPEVEFGLKWVNDIMIGTKKVGGIITEAVLEVESATSSAFVVGIGLNLTTTDFPKALAAIAGRITASAVDRNRLAADLLAAILTMTQTVASGDFLPAYRAASTILGHRVTLGLGDRRVTGVAEEIAANGGLVLQTATGLLTYTSGEVIKVDLDPRD